MNPDLLSWGLFCLFRWVVSFLLFSGLNNRRIPFILLVLHNPQKPSLGRNGQSDVFSFNPFLKIQV